MAASLSAQLIEVCEGLAGRLASGASRVIVQETQARLAEPLRVAVAGRVKAGKSTLVNALLRQRIAPTDVSECTKVAAWFRFGHPERVEVHMRDSTVRPIALGADGMLPRDLGADPADVSSVTVWLSNDALKELTIIDTPGLSSVNETYSSATRDLLARDDASRGAMQRADAVVFLLSGVARQDDAELLGEFRSLVGGNDTSPVNALGVLSKADKIGDGDEDPWPQALALADRCAASLRSVLGTVVPVIGLLAETAEAAVLSERDAANLQILAGLDDVRREVMLMSTDRFLRTECGVPPDTRERLLAILDLYGTARCLEWIDTGITGAAGLAAQLTTRSGVGALRNLLTSTLGHRADVLKAAGAVAALTRMSYEREAAESENVVVLRGLRDELEAVMLRPEMRQLHEIGALQRCASGHVRLPAPLEADVRRVATGSTPVAKLGLDAGADPADVQRSALQGASRWRTFANAPGVGSAQRDVATIMLRSYEAMWEQSAQPAAAAS